MYPLITRSMKHKDKHVHLSRRSILVLVPVLHMDLLSFVGAFQFKKNRPLQQYLSVLPDAMCAG